MRMSFRQNSYMYVGFPMPSSHLGAFELWECPVCGNEYQSVVFCVIYDMLTHFCLCECHFLLFNKKFLSDTSLLLAYFSMHTEFHPYVSISDPDSYMRMAVWSGLYKVLSDLPYTLGGRL